MRIASDELKACWALCGRGEIAQALAQATAVAAHARDAGDEIGFAQASCLCAWFCFQLGTFDVGAGHAGRAQRIFAERREPSWECWSQAIYAWLLNEVGLSEEAAQQAHDAVQRAENLPVDDDAASWAVNTLAVVGWTSKQLVLAQRRSEQAVALARKLGDPVLLRWWLVNLGGIHVEMGYQAQTAGESEAAEAAIRQGLAINQEAIGLAERHGDAWTLKLALCNAVEYNLALEELAAAVAMMERSEAIAPPGSRSLTHHLYIKGQLLARMGDREGAKALLLDCLAAAQRDNNTDCQYHALCYLAEIHEARGEFKEALGFYKQFHVVHSRLAQERTRLRVRLAEVHYQTESLKQAADRAMRRADEMTLTSLTDPLTNLGNRRALDAVLPTLDKDAGPFCVAIVDLDHFKQVNDRFGHLVGDEVLRRVGTTLLAMVAPGDSAIRMGGEEFALILRNVELASGMAICRRLRKRLSQSSWADVHPALTVTASIGVASIREAASAFRVFALADERLYLGKESGRNRVVGAPDGRARPPVMAVAG